ncbi:MAG: CPBP family intramembrane metalloprotease, partial [Clostridia bacterium]|nr:CPBP family intramembrane metalloprotease [Clostridia bacterium]
MTNQYDENLYLDLKDKKNAYFAMCKSTVLLFLFSALSYALTYLVHTLIYSSSFNPQHFLVSILIKLGTGRAVAVSVAKSFLSSGAFSVLIGMITSVFTMLLPAIIFAKAVKLSSDECFSLKGSVIKYFLPMYGVMQLFVLFASSLSTSLYDWFFPDSKVNPSGFTDFSGTEFDIYFLILRILSTCIFVPLMEEYIFRGVIFGYLRRYGTMFAVIASGAIFGIAHDSPSQSVYALVFGIFSAFLVAVTGNIKTSVIFHAINNFISICSEHLIAYTPDSFVMIINCILNIITMFLGFIGIYVICKKDGFCDKFFTLCKNENSNRTVYS